MEKIRSFKQLFIWQKGIDIVKEVYRLSKDFPREELYGLTTQMRRAAISIPSNIAEGFKRNHKNEYRQFLHFALGSAAELETQLIIAQELDFLDKQRTNDLLNQLDHLGRMTSSLLNRLNNHQVRSTNDDVRV